MTSTTRPATRGQVPTRPVRLAFGLVLAVEIGLVGLLVAGQSGLLPKSPAYRGDPADQYRSSQVVGERWSVRSAER